MVQETYKIQHKAMTVITSLFPFRHIRGLWKHGIFLNINNIVRIMSWGKLMYWLIILRQLSNIYRDI